jgi:hypothetical protein
MKIKINQGLVGIDNQPIIDNNKPLLLKDVCIAAALTPVQEDDQKKKFEKWDVFKKLRDFDLKYKKDAPDFDELEIELTAEEITVLKDASGKIHPQLIMGQVFEMLEQKNV